MDWCIQIYLLFAWFSVVMSIPLFIIYILNFNGFYYLYYSSFLARPIEKVNSVRDMNHYFIEVKFLTLFYFHSRLWNSFSA